jgi:hypothetical protein
MIIIDLEVPQHQFPILTSDKFIPTQSLIDNFFIPVRNELIAKSNVNTVVYPHIDFDLIKPFMTNILGQLTSDDVIALKKLGYDGKSISTPEWNKAKEHKTMMVFLWFYPHFSNLLQNIHLLSAVVLRSTEIHLGDSINTVNFVEAKKFIDQINRQRWNRDQDTSERQSGVSNLGSVSEALLENALCELIDNQNFFKTNNQKVQSYGDFVLMCLPNNLWLSVKSNFARERLLASGYTTDILGVGFFTSADEFTSASKIRNFQRVGFLAMYLPEIPISEQQTIDNTNTYTQVMDYYALNGNAPVNINGTSFIRPLSQLHVDLSGVLQTKNIANRTTIEF